MSIESKDKTPFKDELIPNDFDASWAYMHIDRLKNNPSKIVRSERTREIDEDQPQRPLEERLENHKRARILFEELKNEYGIFVPSFDYVVGHDSGTDMPMIYTVTDKIVGGNLEDTDLAKTQVPADKIEQLCLSLINYYSDKYRTGGYFLSDIVLTAQYVYGHKYSEEENKIYLVDVEPLFGNYEINPRRFDIDLYHVLINFPDFFNECESIAGSKLSAVREKFRVFYKSIDSRDSMKRMESFRNIEKF